LDHDILTLKIELEALKRETDRSSIERRGKVRLLYYAEEA
jgi:hypothetical protein